MTTYDRAIAVRCNPITLLRDEWRRINYCQRSLRNVNSWKLRSQRFHSLDEVLKAAGYDGNKCDHQADQVLAAIVRREATPTHRAATGVSADARDRQATRQDSYARL